MISIRASAKPYLLVPRHLLQVDSPSASEIQASGYFLVGSDSHPVKDTLGNCVLLPSNHNSKAKVLHLVEDKLQESFPANFILALVFSSTTRSLCTPSSPMTISSPAERDRATGRSPRVSQLTPLQLDPARHFFNSARHRSFLYPTYRNKGQYREKLQIQIDPGFGPISKILTFFGEGFNNYLKWSITTTHPINGRNFHPKHLGKKADILQSG